MENSQKIIVGNKVLTKRELFEEEKKFRMERAKLSFEEKIRKLVELQRIAHKWGGKKDLIIWKL